MESVFYWIDSPKWRRFNDYFFESPLELEAGFFALLLEAVAADLGASFFAEVASVFFTSSLGASPAFVSVAF